VKISIGLPNWLPRTPGPSLVEFARRAEAAGFARLGTIGRTVFDSHEELIALAAAAGATQRIGLATTVTIGPAREPVLLAKQAATLDAISGGRFALGLGVGWREDDYAATGNAAAFAKRGARLGEQVAILRRVWAGETLPGVALPVGPAPARAGGPDLWIGGYTPAALRRAGRLADGFLALAAPGPAVAAHYAAVSAAAQAAGRKAPRLLGARYFALGDDARATAVANVRAYYGFGGDAAVNGVLAGMLGDADALRASVRELEAAGVEETFYWATNADVAQVERLAGALL
jgi:alkanesulfonate monooxygenase SsuD/methylene tetrahydromethanopterin reductase-like flavin-dependent oxidoreductase (luciferase family)